MSADIRILPPPTDWIKMEPVGRRGKHEAVTTPPDFWIVSDPKPRRKRALSFLTRPQFSLIQVFLGSLVAVALRHLGL